MLKHCNNCIHFCVCGITEELIENIELNVDSIIEIVENARFELTEEDAEEHKNNIINYFVNLCPHYVMQAESK
jgi:3-phosphoglycerate kinase